MSGSARSSPRWLSPDRPAQRPGASAATSRERLRKMRGARGFSEAWDAALEIARDRQLVRLGGTLEGLSEGGEDGHYDDYNDPMRRDDDARERLLNKLLRLKARKTEAVAAARTSLAAGLPPVDWDDGARAQAGEG